MMQRYVSSLLHLRYVVRTKANQFKHSCTGDMTCAQAKLGCFQEITWMLRLNHADVVDSRRDIFVPQTKSGSYVLKSKILSACWL
jgi:hypothetical protein